MKIAKLTLAFSALVGLASLVGAQSLKVGDVAPQLGGEAWLKGAPVGKFQPGQLYVVEFWATWCGPCKASMPHLSELARKYRDRVIFVGVDSREEENGDGKLRTVKNFVNAMGSLMDYRVMYDGARNRTFERYMTASGQKTIPCAFVINGEGKVAWIGIPQNGLDIAIDCTCAGKPIPPFKLNEQQLGMAEVLARVERDCKPLVDADKAKDYARVIIEADKLDQSKRGYASSAFFFKFRALLHLDPAGALVTARENMANKDRAATIISAIQAMDGLSTEAYQLALEGETTYIEKTKEPGPYAFETQSSLFSKLGKKDEAIQALRRARELSSTVSPVHQKEIEMKLRELETGDQH